jgi:hypothetical protein
MIKLYLAISIIVNIYFLITKVRNNIKFKRMSDQVVLTFLKGRDSSIIARNDTGKICLIDKPYCKENRIWVNENEEWRCAISREKENCLIVQPIVRLKTAAESEALMAEKTDSLKSKFNVAKKHSSSIPGNS